MAEFIRHPADAGGRLDRLIAEFGPRKRRGRGSGDAPLDRPERPCARCGHSFQPTVRRRVLCHGCWKGGGDGLDG